MEYNKEKIDEAKARAFDFYAKDQFVCSEAVLYTINGLLGNPLPPGSVRLASGFGGGIGGSGNICGAVTGGVMALGLAFGRTAPGAGCPKLLPATRELLEWFDQRFGNSSCAVLTKKRGTFGGKDSERCGAMTGETAAKTMELVFKYENMSAPIVFLQRVRQAFGAIR